MKYPVWQIVLLCLAAASGIAQPYIQHGAKTVVVKTAGALRPQAHIRVTAVSLPDPKLTPGAIRTTDAHELCSANFRTKKYRVASKATKKEVCAEYGVKDCPHQGKEELDDSVPLELGGANVKANLWVQMAPQYHWKDALENRLKAIVCMQPTIELQNADLAQAQREIRTDWVFAYEKYIGPLPVQ